MKAKPDSIIANVNNLAAVLNILFTQLNIKPFHRSSIQIDGRATDMALLHLGNMDLELIACGNHPDPTNQSGLSNVTIATPLTSSSQTLHLEENLNLQMIPGPAIRLARIDFQSASPLHDAETLLHCFDNSALTTDETGTLCYTLNQIDFIFHHKEPFPADHKNLPSTNPKTEQGWRRVSFTISRLAAAVPMLTAAGAQVAIPPFMVMPGLQEAMLRLPSGIIIQPVEQNLPKMLIHLTLENIKSFFRKPSLFRKP